MNRVLIVLLALTLGGAAYFFLAHDGSDSGPPEPLGPAQPTSTTEEPAPTPELDLPDTEPAVQQPVRRQLSAPARLLLLGRGPDSWNTTVLMMCEQLRQLAYRSWFELPPQGTGGAAAEGRGMTELQGKPTAAYLESEDVSALVLDMVDPNAFAMDFWEAVALRVRDGRMGLWVRPGFPTTSRGVGQSEHPVLSHPILKDLLPIARAAQFQGSPVPGVFREPQPLKPTEVGNTHPCARLVDSPRASARVWERANRGDGALASKFCYPVTELKPNARTLLNCEAATPIPALITGAAADPQRVLWMGNVDFGLRVYYVSSKDLLQKTLINHWIVWLVGQAAE